MPRRKVKLLYIDDVKAHLTNFKAVFSKDFDILTTTSPAEGLEIVARETGIGIVVCDQRMPDMTGVEFFTKMLDINPDPVRIIISAYTDEKDIINAINSGHIYQYIVKPWKKKDLQILLKQARSSFLMAKKNRELTAELDATNKELREANKKLEADFEDLKRADRQIHDLSQKLLKVQEDERLRIALDLHDKVAQDLSSLKLMFEMLFSEFPTDYDDITKWKQQVSEVLFKCIQSVRDLSYELRPPMIDQLGLFDTVKEYCAEFSKNTGVECNFASAGVEELALDNMTAINLYRIIQEALNNVNKHAEADRVTIKLSALKQHIALRIDDNGKGFDADKWLKKTNHAKHLGIRSMQERAGLLGGSLRITSNRAKGTRVALEIPYPEAKEEA